MPGIGRARVDRPAAFGAEVDASALHLPRRRGERTPSNGPRCAPDLQRTEPGRRTRCRSAAGRRSSGTSTREGALRRSQRRSCPQLHAARRVMMRSARYRRLGRWHSGAPGPARMGMSRRRLQLRQLLELGLDELAERAARAQRRRRARTSAPLVLAHEHAAQLGKADRPPMSFRWADGLYPSHPSAR